LGLEEIRRLKEQAKLPKEKKKYTIPKVSAKKKSAPKADEDDELPGWFEDRRKEMKGKCSNCGKRSCAHDDKYYRFSIAHILPKAYFPSVKTHPENWIELCFWGQNSCHTNFDNGILDLTEMSNWNEIIVKFQKLYPLLTAKEKGRVPEILKQYINTDQ